MGHVLKAYVVADRPETSEVLHGELVDRPRPRMRLSVRRYLTLATLEVARPDPRGAGVTGLELVLLTALVALTGLLLAGG